MTFFLLFGVLVLAVICLYWYRSASTASREDWAEENRGPMRW